MPRLAATAATSTQRSPASADKAAARKRRIPPPRPDLRAEADLRAAADHTAVVEGGTNASATTFPDERALPVPRSLVGAAFRLARFGSTESPGVQIGRAQV